MDVITHAPSVVTALYRIGLQSDFSISRIHDSLTESRCAICDRFGGYVNLLDLQRCCRRCAQYDPELQPMPLERAIAEFAIKDEKAIESLPKIVCPPKDIDYFVLPDYESLYGSPDSQGIYSRTLPLQTRQFREVFLVSRAEAKKTSIALGQAPKPSVGFDSETPRRFDLAVIQLPSLDPKTQQSIPAYRCRGCTMAEHCCLACQLSLPNGADIPHEFVPWLWRPRHTEGVPTCKAMIAKGRLYTEDEILVHFADCGETQALMADFAAELHRPAPTEKEIAKKKARKNARRPFGHRRG